MYERLVETALGRLADEGPAHFDGRRVVGVERLRVEARRFSVLAGARLRLEDGTRDLVVKIPRLPQGATPDKVRKVRQRLRQEHDVPRALCRLAREGGISLGLVRPVAFLEDVPALVMERSEGEPLLALLVRRARWYPSASTLDDLAARCAAAGRWLRALQALTRRADERFGVDTIQAYVDSRLERLAGLGVTAAGGWRDGIRPYVEAISAKVDGDDRVVCGVHGDFSLSNLLSTGTETVVLDFSMFQVGSPFQDASRLYHQLGLLGHKPSFRPSTVARLQGAFLAGWSERWTGESPLFRLFLLQHAVSHWLSLVKGDRRSLPARLVDRWSAACDRRDLKRLLAEPA